LILPLYSDDSLLVLNKPSGLASVPGGWEADETSLFEQAQAEYGKLWIVHRLDRVTSGVILFARSAAAHRTLSLLFETRAVHKTYHAIVVGLPPWEEQTCRAPLRADAGRSHRTVVDEARGRAAVTRFRVRERYAAHALTEAMPESGRTHQVRAHAAALTFPILGDVLYGAPPTDLIARPALHAYSLEFEFEGKSFVFAAPYPDDFENALSSLNVKKFAR
jgi:RluA family pseudouridine synthase